MAETKFSLKFTVNNNDRLRRCRVSVIFINGEKSNNLARMNWITQDIEVKKVGSVVTHSNIGNFEDSIKTLLGQVAGFWIKDYSLILKRPENLFRGIEKEKGPCEYCEPLVRKACLNMIKSQNLS